ncbi:MAG: GAF domain-containing protein [Myxococcota bacterium]
MTPLTHPLRLQVHDRHDLPVAGILRLIAQAAAPGELGPVLRGLCREVSDILSAPVVSLYVREPAAQGDVLIMRGNVGLPPGAVDRVRLGLGEGITGFAAECLRPVSVDVGPSHDRFQPVPGIGEERYPCFLAVPVVDGGQALGVMVLQRAPHAPFSEAEAVLGTALAAPLAHPLELARSGRRGSGGMPPRDVALTGDPTVGGSAIGRVRPLPTTGGLLAARAEAPMEVGAAFDAVCRDLARSARRVLQELPPSAVMALGALVPLWSDQRLRGQIVDACAEQGVADGLDSVARAYARAPHRVGSDPASSRWLAERAQDVESLCLLVAARRVGVPMPRPGDVLWVGGHLGGVLAMAAALRRASAVVVGSPVDPQGLSAAILRQAGVPVVASVASLSEWVRPGDRLLVDGSEGVVRVHPAPQRLAEVRLGRRRVVSSP